MNHLISWSYCLIFNINWFKPKWIFFKKSFGTNVCQMVYRNSTLTVTLAKLSTIEKSWYILDVRPYPTYGGTGQQNKQYWNWFSDEQFVWNVANKMFLFWIKVAHFTMFDVNLISGVLNKASGGENSVGHPVTKETPCR